MCQRRRDKSNEIDQFISAHDYTTLNPASGETVGPDMARPRSLVGRLLGDRTLSRAFLYCIRAYANIFVLPCRLEKTDR